MTVPRWTDERTARLTELAAGETPVSKALVDSIAAELETTPRSVSSKLRKMGVDVELASAAPRAFSEEEAEALRAFVQDHSGQLTYAQIAENFAGGRFSAKQIQGKVLSMELTGEVAPTPKPESTKTYTDEEEARIVQMIQEGAFVEDIAEAVGRPVPSVRGKALSLLRAGTIGAVPKQRDVKGQAPDALAALGDISGLSVAQIAEKLEKTERGVKTMLTRRKLTAQDYDGAARAEKGAANATA